MIMGKNKKGYGFDPLEETLKIGRVSTGTMIVGGLPGMMSKSLPETSQTASKISSATSGSLSLLPRVQGMSSVFSSLSMLDDQIKKPKRR